MLQCMLPLEYNIQEMNELFGLKKVKKNRFFHK